MRRALSIALLASASAFAGTEMRGRFFALPDVFTNVSPMSFSFDAPIPLTKSAYATICALGDMAGERTLLPSTNAVSSFSFNPSQVMAGSDWDKLVAQNHSALYSSAYAFFTNSATIHTTNGISVFPMCIKGQMAFPSSLWVDATYGPQEVDEDAPFLFANVGNLGLSDETKSTAFYEAVSNAIMSVGIMPRFYDADMESTAFGGNLASRYANESGREYKPNFITTGLSSGDPLRAQDPLLACWLFSLFDETPCEIPKTAVEWQISNKVTTVCVTSRVDTATIRAKIIELASGGGGTSSSYTVPMQKCTGTTYEKRYDIESGVSIVEDSHFMSVGGTRPTHFGGYVKCRRVGGDQTTGWTTVHSERVVDGTVYLKRRVSYPGGTWSIVGYEAYVDRAYRVVAKYDHKSAIDYIDEHGDRVRFGWPANDYASSSAIGFYRTRRTTASTDPNGMDEGTTTRRAVMEKEDGSTSLQQNVLTTVKDALYHGAGGQERNMSVDNYTNVCLTISVGVPEFEDEEPLYVYKTEFVPDEGDTMEWLFVDINGRFDDIQPGDNVDIFPYEPPYELDEPAVESDEVDYGYFPLEVDITDGMGMGVEISDELIIENAYHFGFVGWSFMNYFSN